MNTKPSVKNKTMTTEITDLRPDYPDTPGDYSYSGVIELYGIIHHAQLIRLVIDSCGLQGPPDDAPVEVHSNFDALQHFYEGRYKTVTVPGLAGEYCLIVYPFGD